MNDLYTNLPDIATFTSSFRAAVPTLTPADLEDKPESKWFTPGLWDVVASPLVEAVSKAGNSYLYIPVADAEGREGRVMLNTHNKDGVLQKFELQRLFRAFGFEIPQVVLVQADLKSAETGHGSIKEFVSLFCRGPVGLEMKWTAPHAHKAEAGAWILVDTDGTPDKFVGLSGDSDAFPSYTDVEKYAREIKKVKYFEKSAKMFLVPRATKTEPAEQLLPYYQELMRLYNAVGSGEAPPPPQAISAPKKPAWMK